MAKNQKVYVQDQSGEKKYFTQIPNIIYQMGLGPYLITYYSILKMISGDKKKCFMSQKNLAKLVGCSDKQISVMNKFLSQPFKILNGKSLIKIKTQKKNGEHSPNIIEIVYIWDENMHIIGNKIPIPQTTLPKKEAKIKKIIPAEPGSPPPEPGSPPPEPGTYKEETIEEDLSKKNDVNVSDDRSLSIDESTVPFDPDTFILPNGEPLSLKMRRAIKKYSETDKQKLHANVCYFIKKVKQGTRMDKPEAYLQNCIKMNYAQQETNSWQNKIYAEWKKEEFKLHGLKILKSVVQFKRSTNEAEESLSFSLPTETFSEILDKYINSKEQ